MSATPRRSLRTPGRTPARASARRTRTLSPARMVMPPPQPPKRNNKFPGRVLTVGSGDISQLGHGEHEEFTELKYYKLVEAVADKDVLQIAAGELHNLVLVAGASGKQVWSWGCGDEGQLGHKEDEWLPAPMEGLEEVNAAQVACGATHSLVLTTEGVVYGCGLYRDLAGPVGFSETEDKRTVLAPIKGLKDIVQVAAGEHHDLALTNTGRVYQWGDVGVGLRQSRRLKKTKLEPRQVLFRSNLRIDRVWAGGHASFAKDCTGYIWAWGPNNYNQLGLPNDEDNSNEEGLIAITVPQKVPFETEIVDIACSTHHSVALGVNGEVFSFGRGDMGRLGHGDEKDRTEPTRIAFFDNLPDGDRVIQVSSGDAHTLAVTAQGHMYAWGYGDLLQLGNGKEVCLLEPFLVNSKEVRERQVVAVQAGSQHSMILARDTPPGPGRGRGGKKSVAAPLTGRKRRQGDEGAKLGDDAKQDEEEQGEEDEAKMPPPAAKKQRQAEAVGSSDSDSGSGFSLDMVDGLWAQVNQIKSPPASPAANQLWTQSMDIPLP